MGKRELGLIAAFVAVGVLIWQFTAPDTGGEGFSFGQLLSNARREMRGRNASAEATTSPAIAIDASVTELRLTLSGEIEIVGETREDVAAELHVQSNGHDEAEARQLAEDVSLAVSRLADSVVVGWRYPEEGRQEARLTLRVPARLRIELSGRGTATVGGVREVALARTGGRIEVNGGETVTGEHRGSRLTIKGATRVDMYSVSSETTIEDVARDLRLNIRTGEAKLARTAGPVTIMTGDASVRVTSPSGNVRVEGVDSEIDIRDASGELDIDVRSSPVTVTWARAATAKIQTRDSRLDLELPTESDTYSVDVRVTGGELRPPATMSVQTDGNESTITKTGPAGAPAIFVRANGSTVAIR